MQNSSDRGFQPLYLKESERCYQKSGRKRPYLISFDDKKVLTSEKAYYLGVTGRIGERIYIEPTRAENGVK